ncbi:AzlC family ABC transporter permease [Acinetobacter chinensis]|uniref:AzlC family ABC transporter permease n=1 Tax=Acinetobacter chinensis TaxID=2004650 RepID=A0ABU3WDV9_9GAMM|nr:AzlC family ABC transporter permease [Acinetobacter chinensis]MDV2468572.1 AzlC family ABC transporter permease [Acinetobacter chinensis]
MTDHTSYSSNFSSPEHQPFKAFRQGALDILPLSIAVLPWGILAGSMAVNAGLSFAQSFAMSSVIFAGAAQLVSLGLVMSDASAITIIITIFFLTTQHLIYALSFRSDVQHFSLGKRLGIGFLLTDELFAVGMAKSQPRTFAYLFGAGLCFYLSWCLFSLMGIVLANAIPDLESLHLDFSIVAVFILIIVPLIKNVATVVGVVVTLISCLIFKYLQMDSGTVLAGLTGMASAALTAKLFNKNNSTQIQPEVIKEKQPKEGQDQ